MINNSCSTSLIIFSWQANKIVWWQVRQWLHLVDKACSQCCRTVFTHIVQFVPKVWCLVMCWRWTVQGYICTTLEVRCSLSAWVTLASSFRVETATSITAFTRPLSVRYRRAAACVSSTIRTLLSCWASPSPMATRQCLSWPRCAQFDWVLWRAGVPSTTDRMWRARRAGLRSTSTDLFTGLTKCCQRWVPHTIPSRQCRK